MGRRSVRLDFRERFTAEHMSRALTMITRALGGFGCVARSVVFMLIGVFIVKAAVLASAKQTKGLDATFRSVASSATAFGCWPCSPPACSATAFTACLRPATAT